jgi:poly(A) polymerase
MNIDCTEKELLIFKEIANSAADLQMPCYIIGGFVRDKLIGRPSKDVDIVCVGDAITLAQAVAKRFEPKPSIAFFKTYGTAQLKFQPFLESEAQVNEADDTEKIKTPALEIEFVGARKESYQLHSRNPQVLPGNLQDDQNRRDFTINALAISLNEENYGQLLDPFNGVADLKKKIIQTPLNPDTTFSDDPLRMLRAIRFATQLQFDINEATWKGIQHNAHRIKIISQERITQELNKILLSHTPSIGFDLLYRGGLLSIIFPALVDLAGAEYIDGKGHKDNFYHTLQVVDNIAPHTKNLWLRWAALLHDIGKPATKRFEEGHGFTFHGHEVVGARMVPKIFTVFKLPLQEPMRFVKKIVALHLRPISLTKENITDSAIRRLLFDAGEDVESLMTLCKADITSKNKQKVTKFLNNFELVQQRMAAVEEKDHIRTWQPPITGELIMKVFGLRPCKMVGDIKTAVKDAILDGVISNHYEDAYAYMLAKAAEWQLKPVL